VTVKTSTFPHYVPPYIQSQVTLLLHGEGASSENDGWIGALARLDNELHRVNELLEDSGWLSEEARSALHRQQRDLSTRIKRAKEEIDCVERLTSRHDPDLEDVYTLLARNTTGDKQAWLFIFSAVSADIEFDRYRDALRSARERKDEIAAAAHALAERLDLFDQTGVQGPDAFWSIRALLERAEPSDANRTVWPEARNHLLGNGALPAASGCEASTTDDEPAFDDSEDLPDGDFTIEELEEGDAATTPEQDLRYAWGVAPSLSALLDTLSAAARDFEPSEHDLIGAALNTRQGSPKTGYIRAFAHLLNENGISRTPPFMRAMAKTATLVLTPKDIIVSYDDVRKALKQTNRI
jgi:hypothetical protein